MEKAIGKQIEEEANKQGYSQLKLADKINLSKQGVASIYKRTHIDTDLLKIITEVLNVDFLGRFYEDEPFKSFKDKEMEEWQQKIDTLQELLLSKEMLLLERERVVEYQRELIDQYKSKLGIDID